MDIKYDIRSFQCDIHISEKEKGWMNQVEQNFGYKGKFWLLNCGSKDDYPLKQWRRDRWQEVVDRFKGRIQFVQVGETKHDHKPLEGVIDMLGKTDMRQLIRLAYHAQGSVCHVTMLNHLMSVWGRPCVVVAGGRESSTWESYNETMYLDTIGALHCCWSGGCWKSRPKDCKHMEGDYPRCMNMITTDDVVNAIERYYIGGRLKY